jgi:ribosomal protein L32
MAVPKKKISKNINNRRSLFILKKNLKLLLNKKKNLKINVLTKSLNF